MKTAVLFSGGKDSCFALFKAMQSSTVSCLLSMRSKNPESFMFHTPNIDLAKLQAQAIGLPLLKAETEGKKEAELKDLKKAMLAAKQKFGIQGVVTGAIQSVYQSSRIRKICDELGLQCINPLWQINQSAYLNDFVESGFRAIVCGVFAYPLDESWLGRELDKKAIRDLEELSRKFKISVAGEGGELETFVFDGPIFQKKIAIQSTEKSFKNNSGTLKITKAKLERKGKKHMI